jgi:RNA polymerase-binding transcription factor DksA
MSAELAIDAPRTRLAIGSPRTRAASRDDAGLRPAGPVGLPAPRPAQDSVAHLAPESLAGWRALLESHWRARLERVTELSLAYHDAEEAGAEYEGRLPGGRPGARQARPLLRQAVAERRELAEIEAALSRLTSGCFGRCERCGGVVPAVQLTRIPQARYCGTCDR